MFQGRATRKAAATKQHTAVSSTTIKKLKKQPTTTTTSKRKLTTTKKLNFGSTTTKVDSSPTTQAQNALTTAIFAATPSGTTTTQGRKTVLKYKKAAFSTATAATVVPEGHFEVFVDDKSIIVPKGFTVFQAAEAAGKDVPRFCYHERLSIAGNCRMCLVEVERVPKPVASCAYPLMAGMKIKTDTPMVKKAREGVLEFILANHPLDCPICDQGGECDLQDQSYDYGSDRSRFREIKRGVEDKYLGPVIKTVMTRCINCTRCVRFAEEVAGVPDLGVTGRGNNAEIGMYTSKVFDSELSGNAVDLCPVGALTNHSYAFRARPWELESTHSIDVSDAIGANLRVDSRGTTVMRVLPRLNDRVNEEWISDKARMQIDGLQHQRLDTPMVRTADGGYEKQTWTQIMAGIKHKMDKIKINNADNDIKSLIGDLTDAETIVALKDLTNKLGSSNTAHADGLSIPADLRTHYLLNTQIADFDQSDVVVLVGSNPRMEAPILNARIRKQTFNRRVPVYGLGLEADLAIDGMKWVGNGDASIEYLQKQLTSPDSKLLKKIQGAKKPIVIFGPSMFANQELSASTLSLMESLTAKAPQLWNKTQGGEWKGLNILQPSASRTASLDLGFVQGPYVDANAVPKVLFAVGADNNNTVELINKMKQVHGDESLVIYMGSHGDITAPHADVILPATAYTEKRASYVNAEGRVQMTNKAVGNKHLAQDEWKILRAMSEVVGAQLPYNNEQDVQKRINTISPTFNKLDGVEETNLLLKYTTEQQQSAAAKKDQKLATFINNHFMTNAICRASPSMAKLSKELPVSRNSYKVKLNTTTTQTKM